MSSATRTRTTVPPTSGQPHSRAPTLAAANMLASRARRRIRGAASEPDRDLARQRDVVTRPLGRPFRPLPAHLP